MATQLQQIAETFAAKLARREGGRRDLYFYIPHCLSGNRSLAGTLQAKNGKDTIIKPCKSFQGFVRLNQRNLRISAAQKAAKGLMGSSSESA